MKTDAEYAEELAAVFESFAVRAAAMEAEAESSALRSWFHDFGVKMTLATLQCREFAERCDA